MLRLCPEAVVMRAGASAIEIEPGTDSERLHLKMLASIKTNLEMTKGNGFFKFLVAQLELGSPSFSADLARLAADPRVVGIRGFLWSPKLTLDQKQLASLEELAAKGMTLDIISRGTLNPKDKVEALATAVPRPVG